MPNKQEFELAYTLSRLKAPFRAKIPVESYVPSKLVQPARFLDVHSAWAGLETLIADLIDRFQLRTERCLEFGVEYGFSAVALSSYFASVTGVDTFQGDRHTNILEDIYEQALENTAPYDNIKLVRSDYQSYLPTDNGRYDLIHVDIIHTFADTFACGLWSAQHSRCTLFHDTESYPQVKQAVREIARHTGKTFYNFPRYYGLGILA